MTFDMRPQKVFFLGFNWFFFLFILFYSHASQVPVWFFLFSVFPRISMPTLLQKMTFIIVVCCTKHVPRRRNRIWFADMFSPASVNKHPKPRYSSWALSHVTGSLPCDAKNWHLTISSVIHKARYNDINLLESQPSLFKFFHNLEWVETWKQEFQRLICQKSSKKNSSRDVPQGQR